jgi:hypothetical protein
MLVHRTYTCSVWNNLECTRQFWYMNVRAYVRQGIVDLKWACYIWRIFCPASFRVLIHFVSRIFCVIENHYVHTARNFSLWSQTLKFGRNIKIQIKTTFFHSYKRKQKFFYKSLGVIIVNFLTRSYQILCLIGTRFVSESFPKISIPISVLNCVAGFSKYFWTRYKTGPK